MPQKLSIHLPYGFAPRSYQWRPWRAYDQGIRRFGLVWHRRSGKDKTALNFTVERMVERVGNYGHIFPMQNQGRRVIWQGIDRDGRKYLDHFPKELLYREPNNTDMSITLKNMHDPRLPGSTWQILGTDRNIDALVGSNMVGLVFSEYALQNPQAWRLAQPILRENGGWALFAYTPRGKNHGYDLYTQNRNNPEWYFEVLPVTETRRDAPGEDGSPVISEEQIEADKREGMSQDLVDQEYYLSWEAAIPGAYYANEFRLVDQEKRITKVPWDRGYPVYTFWDLGVDDATAMWFVQFIGRQISLVHYYEASGYGAAHYADYLATLPYEGHYRAHLLPHDGRAREWGSGERREAQLQRLVQGQVLVTQRPSLETGIANVRAMFPRCWFDEDGTAAGVHALRDYAHRWDDVKRVFANQPDHNHASHGADAFRTLAVSLPMITVLEKRHEGRPAPSRVNRPPLAVVGGRGWMR